MKSEKDIEKKLVQVRFRHLKKALRTGLSRKPENCVYNAKLGQGNKPDSPRVGVCMYGVKPGGGPRGVCDDCFGGKNRASTCPEFDPARDAGDIRRDFDGFLQSANQGEVAFHFPDIAALLWALGDHPSLETVIPDDEILPEVEQIQLEEQMAEAKAEMVPLVRESLWSRFRVWVQGIFNG